jgi:hypothetical protein
MESTIKKNKSVFNKCIKALIKYNALNDERDHADNEGNEKLVNRLNTKCSNAFDKYMDYLQELPKYEQKRIQSSDLYLYC